MTLAQLRRTFRSVWLVDFEYRQLDGECPIPLCLVAIELFTGKVIRQWAPFGSVPPYDFGDSR
jgi:hypothetical protein